MLCFLCQTYLKGFCFAYMLNSAMELTIHLLQAGGVGDAKKRQRRHIYCIQLCKRHRRGRRRRLVGDEKAQQHRPLYQPKQAVCRATLTPSTDLELNRIWYAWERALLRQFAPGCVFLASFPLSSR